MPLSTYGQYLASKKSVDDRSLNASVLKSVQTELARLKTAPRVLEIGAGLGTMPVRLHELGLLARAQYTLLDSDAVLLREAREWLSAWAERQGLQVRDATANESEITGGTTHLSLRFVCADIDTFFAEAEPAGRFDLLVANAVLDLVDVAVTLPQLLGQLVPGGIYWFSVNFDGETMLLPELPEDAHFMAVYHRSMDQRLRDGRPAGDSKIGRRLFGHLRANGARILSAGSSDWVVFADQGRYPHDEAEFLRHILGTIGSELLQHTDVDKSALEAWISTRSAQLDHGELVYVAHQLDFCGLAPAP